MKPIQSSPHYSSICVKELRCVTGGGDEGESSQKVGELETGRGKWEKNSKILKIVSSRACSQMVSAVNLERSSFDTN